MIACACWSASECSKEVWQFDFVIRSLVHLSAVRRSGRLTCWFKLIRICWIITWAIEAQWRCVTCMCRSCVCWPGRHSVLVIFGPSLFFPAFCPIQISMICVGIAVLACFRNQYALCIVGTIRYSIVILRLRGLPHDVISNSRCSFADCTRCSSWGPTGESVSPHAKTISSAMPTSGEHRNVLETSDVIVSAYHYVLTVGR